MSQSTPALAETSPGESEPPPAELPAELVDVHPPVRFWSGPLQIWRSLREHRHLVANFMERDIRLKFRDSALGYFWSLLEPLLMSAVYYLLYVIIAGNPEKRHALWIILGVITWQFFAKALSGALISISKNEALIKQVYFPREIFAITAVGSQLIMAALSLLIAIPAMVYFKMTPTVYLLMVPGGLVLAALLACGIGMAVAPLNVVNHDMEHLFKFLTRAGLFMSPVLWTLEKVPHSRKAALAFIMYNPMVLPITMVRNGIAGWPLGIDTFHVVYAVSYCVIAFIGGAMIFKRFESEVVKKL
jgi:homopolymeric O-antigen transport system permease protein